MNEVKQLNRIARQYETMFQEDTTKVRDNIDFHIEQLELVIETAKTALNVTSDEIQSWAETMQVVSEVDDANTWLKRLELKIMKWYVNFKYDRALKYSYNIGQAIERLEKVHDRLNVIKAVCCH